MSQYNLRPRKNTSEAFCFESYNARELKEKLQKQIEASKNAVVIDYIELNSTYLLLEKIKKALVEVDSSFYLKGLSEDISKLMLEIDISLGKIKVK